MSRVSVRALQRAHAKGKLDGKLRRAIVQLKNFFHDDPGYAGVLSRVAQKFPHAYYDMHEETWVGIPRLADPKDTDEVVEAVTYSSEEVHGGEHSSGEVQSEKRFSSSKTMTEGFFSFKQSVKTLREVENALRLWLVDAGDEAVPRFNRQEAWRVKTFSFSRMREREEAGSPALLILVDASGSCLGFTPKAASVAFSIMKARRDFVPVIAVVHSNGFPLEVYDGRQVIEASKYEPLSARDEDDEAVPAWYVKVAVRNGISHVLALGDADAEPTYSALAQANQITSVLWLDYHGSRSRSAQVSRQHTKGKLVHVIGCSEVPDLIKGLELAIAHRAAGA